MSELAQLNRWFQELNEVVCAEGLDHDSAIRKQLSLIEIELSALELRLPNLDDSIQASLVNLHQANIIESILSTLQSCLGYYSLPARSLGENEPPIAPEIAQYLKEQLVNQQVANPQLDIYSIKNLLSESLSSSTKDKGEKF